MLYLLHQAGKVASQTLESAIRNNKAPASRIERHHYLSEAGLSALQGTRHDTQAQIESAAEQLGWARSALTLLHAQEDGEVCVITGLRDPLDVAVAAFFQNLGLDDHRRLSDNQPHDAKVEELIEQFGELFEATYREAATENFLPGVFSIAQWFADEFEPFHGFGIDAIDIGTDQPFISFTHGRWRYLVYRTEHLRRSLDDLLKAIGLWPRVSTGSQNVASDKAYSRLYASFKQRFVPTQQMIDYFYGSEFGRRFYPRPDAACRARTRPSASPRTVNRERCYDLTALYSDTGSFALTPHLAHIETSEAAWAYAAMVPLGVPAHERPDSCNLRLAVHVSMGALQLLLLDAADKEILLSLDFAPEPNREWQQVALPIMHFKSVGALVMRNLSLNGKSVGQLRMLAGSGLPEEVVVAARRTAGVARLKSAVEHLLALGARDPYCIMAMQKEIRSAMLSASPSATADCVAGAVEASTSTEPTLARG